MEICFSGTPISEFSKGITASLVGRERDPAPISDKILPKEVQHTVPVPTMVCREIRPSYERRRSASGWGLLVAPPERPVRTTWRLVEKLGREGVGRVRSFCPLDSGTMNSRINRRRFLEKSATLAGAMAVTSFDPGPANAARKRTAADQVTLGRTGIRLSRLGIGTGSNSGEVQRGLGREGFNRLIRHAYDRGITYIDTAESYKNHDWIREAIKGLPREKLFIQTKMSGVPERPLEVIDRFRRELNVDYIDSLLSHYATTGTWDEERRRVLDALEEAKEKKIIRAKGVSCHGLPALTRATRVNWVEVHLVRLNPMGRRVDGATHQWDEVGRVSSVVDEIKAMRAQGRGVIGMKLIGNGDFKSPDERERSIRYVMQSDLVDAVVIGFASSAEIDEAIERIDRALADA